VALCRLSYASEIDKRTGAAAARSGSVGKVLRRRRRHRPVWTFTMSNSPGRTRPARRRPRVSHRARHAAHVGWRARTQRASREQKSVRMFSQVAWAISPSRLLAEGFSALPPVSPV